MKKEINFEVTSNRFWKDWPYDIVVRSKFKLFRVQTTIGGKSEFVTRLNSGEQIRIEIPKLLVDLLLKFKKEQIYIYI